MCHNKNNNNYEDFGLYCVTVYTVTLNPISDFKYFYPLHNHYFTYNNNSEKYPSR